MPLKTGVEQAAVSDLEAAGHWLAYQLSRFHFNGWVALILVAVANVLGVVFHV